MFGVFFFVYFQGSTDACNNQASAGVLRTLATLAVKLHLEKPKSIKTNHSFLTFLLFLKINLPSFKLLTLPKAKPSVIERLPPCLMQKVTRIFRK